MYKNSQESVLYVWVLYPLLVLKSRRKDGNVLQLLLISSNQLNPLLMAQRDKIDPYHRPCPLVRILPQVEDTQYADTSFCMQFIHLFPSFPNLNFSWGRISPQVLQQLMSKQIYIAYPKNLTFFSHEDLS